MTNTNTPAANVVELHRKNVEGADKVVAMRMEMLQACEQISRRYDDHVRLEINHLRALLSDATLHFNKTVADAFSAGLTFDQVESAAKRYGLQSRPVNPGDIIAAKTITASRRTVSIKVVSQPSSDGFVRGRRVRYDDFGTPTTYGRVNVYRLLD